MKKTKVDFPYPILNNNADDYSKECCFNISQFEKVEETDVELILHMEYELKCAVIEKLVREKKAKVCAFIESPKTSFRRNEYFDGKSLEIRVDKSKVSQKVIVKPLIIATTEILDYYSSDFNYDYFGTDSFSLEKGDILAFEFQYELIIDNVDDLKNCASIFTIRLDEKTKEPITVDYHADKINIIMNPVTYTQYSNLRNRSEIRLFLSGVIVFPVLVEAVEALKRVQNDPELDVQEKRWFLALEKQIKRKGIKFDSNTSSVQIANAVIGDVVNSSMLELDNLIQKMEMDQEDIK